MFAPASCLRSDWIEFGQPKGWPGARSAEGESHGWDEHIPLHATSRFIEVPRKGLFAYLAERRGMDETSGLTPGGRQLLGNCSATAPALPYLLHPCSRPALCCTRMCECRERRTRWSGLYLLHPSSMQSPALRRSGHRLWRCSLRHPEIAYFANQRRCAHIPIAKS